MAAMQNATHCHTDLESDGKSHRLHTAAASQAASALATLGYGSFQTNDTQRSDACSLAIPPLSSCLCGYRTARLSAAGRQRTTVPTEKSGSDVSMLSCLQAKDAVTLTRCTQSLTESMIRGASRRCVINEQCAVTASLRRATTNLMRGGRS